MTNDENKPHDIEKSLDIIINCLKDNKFHFSHCDDCEKECQRFLTPNNIKPEN
jgi:hypothetical protein